MKRGQNYYLHHVARGVVPRAGIFEPEKMDRRGPCARSACMADVLILGASGGIGSALSAAHQARGDAVTGLSRSRDGFDVTDAASVDAALAGLGPFDRVIVATGALEIAGAVPEKTIRAVTAKAMADQFAVNAIGPALVLAHAHDLLKPDGI